MNWVTQAENSKRLVIGGVLLVALISLVVTSLRSPTALDPFWHLQMGKDWIENGLSPWIDHYSFTFLGHEITNPPVVFQALLHLLVSQFGISAGFAVFRLTSFILVLGAAVLLLRQIKASAMIFAIVLPMIVYLLQLRAMVRPELVSYTFSIIALMLYFRAENRVTLRHMLPMVVLMWIWSVYHSSVVGYVIFSGFFLDCAAAQFKSRASAAVWAGWLGWGLLIIAVGFLNPGFSHPLIESVLFPSEWKIMINEYLPPASFSMYRSAGMGAVLVLTLLTPILAFKQRKFGFLLIWVVLINAAATMQRMVTPSGIIVVLLAAQVLVGNIQPHQLKLTFLGRRSAGAVSVLTAILVVMVLYSNIERAHHYVAETRNRISHYPQAMADYMIDGGLTGRIFNDYGIGGYFIYRLSGQNQVYIDGRTQILYPLTHMQTYDNATKSAESLRAEIEKFGISQIVTEYVPKKRAAIVNMGGFGLDFVDAYFALYTSGPSNFPLLGRLISQPACWRPDMLEELNAERRKMDEVLPAYSALFPYADFVVGFSNAEDGIAYFDASIDGQEWTDEMRRFAGFRFFATGRYDIAAILFGGVQARLPQDFLAPAVAMMRDEKPEVAVEILAELSDMTRLRLDSMDFSVLYHLYKSLVKQGFLGPGGQRDAESLRARLPATVDPDAPVEFGVNMFCSPVETAQSQAILN